MFEVKYLKIIKIAMIGFLFFVAVILIADAYSVLHDTDAASKFPWGVTSGHFSWNYESPEIYALSGYLNGAVFLVSAILFSIAIYIRIKTYSYLALGLFCIFFLLSRLGYVKMFVIYLAENVNL